MAYELITCKAARRNCPNQHWLCLLCGSHAQLSVCHLSPPMTGSKEATATPPIQFLSYSALNPFSLSLDNHYPRAKKLRLWVPSKTDRCNALLGLVVGDACEEGEGLVQLAKPQPAAEATLLSNFPHGAVQACCAEGSLKQLSCEASPSLFKSAKAAALFAGRVRWKLLRLKKSRRDKKKKKKK